MIRTAAEETREDKIGHIGREIVNGVPPGVTATSVLIHPSLYPVEERPTKKRPAEHIRRGIKTTETLSRLNYRARGCSSGSRQ